MYYAYADALEAVAVNGGSEVVGISFFDGCMSDSERFISVKNDRIVLHSKDRVLKLSLSGSHAMEEIWLHLMTRATRRG